MYFKQFLNELCGCASYVIASRRTHEAAIIDPAIETEPYEALLCERGFRLHYVIDTHIHADHVSGARRLASQHGGQLCLHESAQVAYPFRPLRDHEELGDLHCPHIRLAHPLLEGPESIRILRVKDGGAVVTEATVGEGSSGLPLLQQEWTGE